MKKILLAAIILVLIHGFSSAADLTSCHCRLGVAKLEYRAAYRGCPWRRFFKEEGLDVRPVTLSSSGPIMMALLMSGQADIVIAGAVAILRGIARGAPVVVAVT